MSTKVCSLCCAEKLKKDFYRDSSKKDGYYSRCKQCKRIALAKTKTIKKTIRKTTELIIETHYFEEEIQIVTKQIWIQINENSLGFFRDNTITRYVTTINYKTKAI